MASNKRIVLAGEPQGVTLEGIVSGTPKPGTMMQIKAAIEPLGGRFTWEVFNGAADGEQTLVAILVEQGLQGKTVDDAFVDATRISLYCPIPGESMHVLLENQAGTADAFAIGDKLMVDDGTGKFLATTGAVESEPFIVTETLAAILVDTLIKTIYTGH